MAIVTGGQIEKYYESYSEIDVSFNKQVIEFTGLNPYEIFMRVTGFRIPCIVYSASMIGAMVLANLESEQFEKVRESNSKVSLRFSFRREDDTVARAFFVASKVTGFRPYNQMNPSRRDIGYSAGHQYQLKEATRAPDNHR
jgi:hypothetical protein